MRALLQSIDRTKVSPEMDLKIGQAFVAANALEAAIGGGDANKISGAMRGLSNAMGDVASSAADMGGQAADAGVELGGLGQRALGTATGGLLQMVATGALVASALLFLLPIVVALGGAFVALAGSLAAALAVAGAVSVAFGAVMLGALAGVVAVIATLTQGMERQEEAAQKLAAAEDRHRAAIEARKSAQDRVVAAEAALGDAQTRELVAQDNLNAAREEAVRLLEDMRNAADDAALSEKQAEINLVKAQKALAKLEDTGGTRLERQQARLDVRRAEEALEQARLNGGRAAEDLAEAEAKGIEGADNVVAAKRELAAAHEAVIEASRAATRAEADFLKAQRRSAATAREMARRQRHVDNARRGGIGGFARAWQMLQRVFAQVGRALKPIIRAIGGFMRTFGRVLKDLQPAIRRTAAVFGRVIGRIARELAKPAWQRFFRLILRTMRELAGPAGKIFTSLANVFRKIAKAAMPLLVEGFRSIARWLDDVNRGTSSSEIEKWLRGLLPAFRAWKRLIVAIANNLLALFDSGEGAGTRLVRWIAKGIEDFTAWLRDPKNKGEIRKFFNDAIDLVKDLIRVLIRMGRVAIRWFQRMKPNVQAVLRAFESIVGAIETIIEKIPDIGKALSGIGGPLFDLMGSSTEAQVQMPGDAWWRKRGAEKGDVLGFENGRPTINGKPVRGPGGGRKPRAASRRMAPGAPGAGGGDVNINLTVPGGGSPDPEAAAAAIGRRLRDKGLALG